MSERKQKAGGEPAFGNEKGVRTNGFSTLDSSMPLPSLSSHLRKVAIELHTDLSFYYLDLAHNTADYADGRFRRWFSLMLNSMTCVECLQGAEDAT